MALKTDYTSKQVVETFMNTRAKYREKKDQVLTSVKLKSTTDVKSDAGAILKLNALLFTSVTLLTDVKSI